MTRIAGLGRASPIRSATGARPAATGFRVVEDFATRSLAATGPLGGLLAVQEIAEIRIRDRAAQIAGETVLGALGGVQAAGLAGDGARALACLHDAVASMIEPDDPALQRIIGAIRLRARVELARHQPFGSAV